MHDRFYRFFFIHPMHRDSLHKVVVTVGIMFIAMLAVIFMPTIVEAKGLKEYLPLHMTLETTSIIVSMLIFALGWTTATSKLPTNIVILSIIFLGIGILDFSHMLSYAGMPDFITANNAEKSIDFWLAARVFTALGILLFLSLPEYRLDLKRCKYLAFFAVLFIVGAVHWSIFYGHDVSSDHFFIEGQGLTALKINVEYSIIALDLITALLLLHRMRHTLDFQASSLFGAVSIMAMSELLFTLYTEVSDFYNVFGHIYKTIAFWYIYKAIFVTIIERPYKELEDSRQELRESNQLLTTIIDNIPHMIFLKDASKLRFVLLNKAGETLLKTKRQEFIGKNDYDLFSKEQADLFIRKDRETLNSYDILDIEQEAIQTPHGARVLHTKKISLRDELGHPKYLLGISEDITEKRDKEQKLIESARSLKESQEIAGLGSYVLDLRAGTWSSSEILDSLFGIDQHYERSIEAWATLVHPDDRTRLSSYLNEVLEQRKPFNAEYRIVRDDDKVVRWMHGLGKLEYDDQNNVIMMKGTILDITEQKRLEEELRDHEEMIIAQSRYVAMGEMIGMIAHQWRQPLTVIAMDANNILVDIELQETDVEHFKNEAKGILKQTEYLSKTIDDFRNFFRPNKEKDDTNVYELVMEAQLIMGKSLEYHNIDFIVEGDRSIIIQTFSRELLQVLLNLIKNAKEALEEKKNSDGSIRVTIKKHEGTVAIEVCDNGKGIKKEIIDQIFDPYFSTKDIKTGTGLGLYMSKTIVTKHLAGTIQAENQSVGVCFKVGLPVASHT